MEETQDAENQQLRLRRPSKGFTVNRTGSGNTIFSILKSQSNLMKVLNYVLEESYYHEGVFFTSGRRIEKMVLKTGVYDKSIYKHLAELVELKILLKLGKGEYALNKHIIWYINRND